MAEIYTIHNIQQFGSHYRVACLWIWKCDGGVFLFFFIILLRMLLRWPEARVHVAATKNLM